MTNIFEVCRQLDMVQIAEVNGFEVKHGFVSCPFHGSDTTPSLKLYSNSWYCYGCGEGGDAVTFISKLYNLTPLESVKWLDSTFHLNLPLHAPQTAAQRQKAEREARRRRQLIETRRLFENWRQEMALQLAQAHRTGYLALRDKPPAIWTDSEITAIKWLDALADWADALDGNPSEQMAVFHDRKGVERLCEKILTSETLTKSATA